MSDIGPVEQWVRRWGHPNESGDRVWFAGEIEAFDSNRPELGPEIIVPIFEFAKEHDAEDAALRAALRQAGEELRGISEEAYRIAGGGKTCSDQHIPAGRLISVRSTLAAIEALEVKGG